MDSTARPWHTVPTCEARSSPCQESAPCWTPSARPRPKRLKKDMTTKQVRNLVKLSALQITKTPKFETTRGLRSQVVSHLRPALVVELDDAAAARGAHVHGQEVKQRRSVHADQQARVVHQCDLLLLNYMQKSGVSRKGGKRHAKSDKETPKRGYKGPCSLLKRRQRARARLCLRT